MAVSGAPLVKMANDGIDPEQHEPDDQGDGKETGIENYVSGLGHIGYERLADAGHASSLRGVRHVGSFAPLGALGLLWSRSAALVQRRRMPSDAGAACGNPGGMGRRVPPVSGPGEPHGARASP